LSRGEENSFFCPNTSGKLAKNSAHPPVSRPGNEAKPKEKPGLDRKEQAENREPPEKNVTS
jgi:hypothetical protein